MSTWRDRMNEMITELQQERDELRVKLHLGKADLKDELAELDAKLDTLRGRAAEWADKADDQLDDVVADVRSKADGWLKEIREGFGRVRDNLTKDDAPPPPPPM